MKQFFEAHVKKKVENYIQIFQPNPGVLSFSQSFKIAALCYHHVLRKGHM